MNKRLRLGAGCAVMVTLLVAGVTVIQAHSSGSLSPTHVWGAISVLVGAGLAVSSPAMGVDYLTHQRREH